MINRNRNDVFGEFCCVLLVLLATVTGLSIAVSPSSFFVLGPGKQAEFASVVTCDELVLLAQCRDGEDPTIREGEALVVLGARGSQIAIRRSNLCRRGNVNHLAVGSVGTCAGSTMRTLMTLGSILAMVTICCIATPCCLLLK